MDLFAIRLRNPTDTPIETVVSYWFWTAWNRFKIRPVHKKDGYVSLPSRRYCASLLLSTMDFASLRHGYL